MAWLFIWKEGNRFEPLNTSNTSITCMQLSVKEVDEKIFREFKAEAIKDGFKVGKALNLAMKLWLDKIEKKPKVSFLDLKPSHWGKGTERTSEEIDKILYGN